MCPEDNRSATFNSKHVPILVGGGVVLMLIVISVVLIFSSGSKALQTRMRSQSSEGQIQLYNSLNQNQEDNVFVSGAYTISVDQSSAQPGGEVTVRYAAPEEPRGYIHLCSASADPTDYRCSVAYPSNIIRGYDGRSGVYIAELPTFLGGVYEFRVLIPVGENEGKVVARSNPMRVGIAGQINNHKPSQQLQQQPIRGVEPARSFWSFLWSFIKGMD